MASDAVGILEAIYYLISAGQGLILYEQLFLKTLLSNFALLNRLMDKACYNHDCQSKA